MDNFRGVVERGQLVHVTKELEAEFGIDSLLEDPETLTVWRKTGHRRWNSVSGDVDVLRIAPGMIGKPFWVLKVVNDG